MKICVYAIAKNEEQFVERFCKSAEAADLILIADTGSTDRTKELATEGGAIVYDIGISPFRFDHARNAALALVPADVDVCVSLDLDEILLPGWRAEIERLWQAGTTTRLRYFYEWGKGSQFKYEKIHARHGYEWHHPCHEYPRPDGRIREIYAESDMLLVRHLPDPEKSRGQYLDLLRMSVEEDPHCPRNAFYYGRELYFYRRYQDAIGALNKYLSMPEAEWLSERCYAYRVMGRCYEGLNDDYKAEQSYLRACAEKPDTRDPWLYIAQFYYRKCRWSDLYYAAKRILGINDGMYLYTTDPAAWAEEPFDLASIAAWHLGLSQEAIEYGREAVRMNPNDDRLVNNLRLFIEGVPQMEAAE